VGKVIALANRYRAFRAARRNDFAVPEIKAAE